ncbi:MAG: hypothetical protein ACLRM8_07015 [Alistipes sp.]
MNVGRDNMRFLITDLQTTSSKRRTTSRSSCSTVRSASSASAGHRELHRRMRHRPGQDSGLGVCMTGA